MGSGIAAAAAMTIGGALPANTRDWEEYSARFDRSISDGLPGGLLRPDDETAGKAVAKNYDVTNKITNRENANLECGGRVPTVGIDGALDCTAEINRLFTDPKRSSVPRSRPD